MVGELHATVEQKYGTTSAEAESGSVEQKVTLIEQTFAMQNQESAKEAVTKAAKRMDANEKRLGKF